MIEKDIDLCGIGNALVDIQFEATFEELEEMKLVKGGMCLVEVIELEDLIKKMGARKNFKSSGGSAANTVIAFTKFGGKAAYLTALGKDEFGKFYSDEFHNIGIELKAAEIEEMPTGICMVLITPDSERTMQTHLGATSQYHKDHLDEELIKRSKWLYAEGYKFTATNGAEAMEEAVKMAKKYDTKVAVTFSDAFIVDSFREQLDKVIKESELLFCNELEALTYAETASIEDAFNELCAVCPNVVLTRGTEGSLIKWDGKRYEVAAYDAKAVDTTGAGDMYAAGFFYGIIHHKDPLIAGQLGSYAAAKVVSQMGARLMDDHIELKNKIINK
jgi:sugar/nucleoside kinase (ribokinase family)